MLSHHFPDGDTLGSRLRFAALCSRLERRFLPVATRSRRNSGIWFSGLEDAIYPLPADFEPELIVSVDVADVDLLGPIADLTVKRWISH